MLISFPPIEDLPPGGDLVFIGGDLRVDNLVAGYSAGYFPMPLDDEIGWFSPEKRAVLLPGKLHVSRSLTKSMRKFETSIDQSFEAVMKKCGDPQRPHGWINDEFIRAYCDLYKQNKAHSFEVLSDAKLVGGLYGVEVGSLFAGESMFHSKTDGSKVAMHTMVEYLDNKFDSYLIDAQWLTPHLESMGFQEVSRQTYAKLLAEFINE